MSIFDSTHHTIPPRPILRLRRDPSPHKMNQIILFSVLLVLGIICIFPFLWMISTSFKYAVDALTTTPNLLPVSQKTGRFYLDLDNYRRIFGYGAGRALLNSFIVVAVLIPSKLFLDALAAYAFARIPFPGRDRLFSLLLASIMVPGVALLIPRVYITKVFGIYDTLWALIIPSLISIWDIFLMRQFFLTIPQELEEVAMLDGASRLRIFLQVIVPNAQPVLAVVVITSFIFHWNDLIWPLVTLNNPDNYTLPVELSLLSSLVPQPQLTMAGATIAVIPVFIVFLIFQRRILQGITLTGLKG